MLNYQQILFSFESSDSILLISIYRAPECLRLNIASLALFVVLGNGVMMLVERPYAEGK